MSLTATARHDYIFPPQHRQVPVHIIGAGATGSKIFLSLIDLGMTNLHVYDFDTIEAHNISNQAYSNDQIGKTKVAALRELVQLKAGQRVVLPKTLTFNEVRLPHPSVKLGGIVFLLTDTMESRREIFEACIKNNPAVTRLIETRMASSYGDVYSVDPENYGRWVETLIDDGIAETSPCGAPISVGPTAHILANLAIWQMIHSVVDPLAVHFHSYFLLKPFVITTED